MPTDESQDKEEPAKERKFEVVLKTTNQASNQIPSQIPKYSIVPRFWTNSAEPLEILCLDLVDIHNKVNGEFYVKFIDTEGRMGMMKSEDVGIRFIQNPTQEDIEDFQRLKKDVKEFEKKFAKKDNQDNDRNRDIA